MRIKKYDFDYGRRALMEKVGKGVATGGVLSSLWPLIGNSGDVTKAYPEELLHIEALTKGKIKVGDYVDSSNVDVVKDLFDPVCYQQIKSMGRKVKIVATNRDATTLFPQQYLRSTLKNNGRAMVDGNGNIWDKSPGNPWIGGNPFPEAKTGYEAMANLTLAWGRHDYSQYAIRDHDLDPSGNVAYQYDFEWVEMNTTARPDGSVFQGRKDLLRFQSVFFTSPQDTAGSSFLSTWYYDQRKFPDLYGYLPAFKRVRQFPTNQRFEPLVPGITLFLSDAWASGDPLATWGNYKIVGRQPFLGAVSGGNFHPETENWEPGVHGGPKGQTFYDLEFELIPEVLVVEAEPTGYPRAPVGKKRVWIDARNMMFPTYVTFDRRGQIWKSFEPGFAQYKNARGEVKEEDGTPAWSWLYVHSHDIQANRMSRFWHVKKITGGYDSHFGTHGEDVYNKYLTIQAIARLGSA
jgi:hypothetical protein